MADIDISNIGIFKDDAFVYETVGGVKIDETSGKWSFVEFKSSSDFLKNFGEFEGSVVALQKMTMGNNVTVTEKDGEMTVSLDDSEGGFDSNGTLKEKLYTCPECGKRVKQLKKNGYCSLACAIKARAAKALSSISSAGEKTLEIIGEVQKKLQLLDAALNILQALPDIILQKARLPEVYREYITLRIDSIFIKMKCLVNIIMIQKNELLMQILRKIKTGALDETMIKIFQPINTIILTIAAVQTALNTALDAVIKALNTPGMGIEPLGHGFFLTAKSVQVGQYASDMLIPIVPDVNKVLPIKTALNCIPYEKIDNIVKKALPPILEVEYFMPPELFKVRFQLSYENGPRVKKAWEMLEALMKFSAECLPRYKNLKLTNPWYVIAILTGWGPITQKIYGDFIFHGSI